MTLIMEEVPMTVTSHSDYGREGSAIPGDNESVCGVNATYLVTVSPVVE